MSSTLIEHARNLHSEVVSDRSKLIQEILNPVEGSKKAVFQNHLIKYALQRIVSNKNKLINIYEDKNNVLADIERKISSRNNLGTFYSRLNDLISSNRNIKELKRKNLEESNEIITNVSFTGEEFYGKYVDMHSLYDKFLNVKGLPFHLSKEKRINYRQFLISFADFHNIKKSAKTDSYLDLLKDILKYLKGFYERKNPLLPVNDIIKEINKKFELNWSESSVLGWQKDWPKDLRKKFPPIGKELCKFIEKDKKISKDKKDDKDKDNKNTNNKDNNDQKINDSDDTNYCSSCDKKFKKTVWGSHLKGKKHKRNEEIQKKRESKNKEIANLEYSIKIFKNLIFDTIRETITYLEKKATRSYNEIQKELEAREEEDEEEDFKNEDVNKDSSLWNGGVYNPKKLPLGWDGRPIPYWLYKFHGLNVPYNCEICGGTSYYGPRSFQRHFREWKHAHGMRALGIPNTKDFHNITKIDEAEELYKKIQDRKLNEAFNPLLEEEFEDNDGNVYGKQTYEALKRQRVI